MPRDLSNHDSRKLGDNTCSLAATRCLGLLQHFVVLSRSHLHFYLFIFIFLVSFYLFSLVG